MSTRIDRYGWVADQERSALRRLAKPRRPRTWIYLLAILALTLVAGSWFVPALQVGVTSGWGTEMSANSARSPGLVAPAWAVILVGIVYLAILAYLIPVAVKEARRARRLPEEILTLGPVFMTVYAKGAEESRAIRWHDVIDADLTGNGVELVVREDVAERLPTHRSGGRTRVIIEGDAGDVPVIQHYLTHKSERSELGSESSLARVVELRARGTLTPSAS